MDQDSSIAAWLLDPEQPTPCARRLRGATLGAYAATALSRLLRAPETARALLHGIRAVLRARWALGRTRDPSTLLPAISPALGPPGFRCARRRFRTVRGIRLASRILKTNPQGDCLVRSLAIYAGLRRQGWPVQFVSGVRRDALGVVGHAWVELEGKVLWELREPANRRMYQVNFVFPAAPAGAGSDLEGGVAQDEPARSDAEKEIGDQLRHRGA
jgi:hypothetical protein